MPLNDTETSSLTSNPSLTQIHGKSDLQTEHTSRHTKTGFLVEGPYLSLYIPTPASKRPTHSWVFEHGEALTRKSDNKRCWLCRLCYDKDPQKKPIIVEVKPTTPAIRHLVDEHQYNSDGSKQRKRKADDEETVVQKLQRATASAVDIDEWKALHLAWAITDDVSLNKTTSKRLRRLLGYSNPLI